MERGAALPRQGDKRRNEKDPREDFKMEARAAPGHFPVRLTLTQAGIALGRSGPNCPARRKKGNKKEKRKEKKEEEERGNREM